MMSVRTQKEELSKKYEWNKLTHPSALPVRDRDQLREATKRDTKSQKNFFNFFEVGIFGEFNLFILFPM
jgi:hypothetical protein